MRWIFATLLAVNVLIFLYFQFFDSNSSGGDRAVVVLDGAIDGGAKGNTASNDVAPSSESLVLLGEQPVTGEGERVIPDTIDNVQPDAIRIVSEFPEQVITPASDVQAGVEGAPLCSLVGEFATLLKAEYFLERLTALGVQADVKSLVVSSKVSFWLVLPPEVSRKEALRRLSELKRQGIDSYVIPSGEIANGISIGLYSDKERAEAVKKSIVKLGYSPEVKPLARDKKEIWVFLPRGESSKISPERWSELLSGKELLQKRQNLCSDVASEAKFL